MPHYGLLAWPLVAGNLDLDRGIEYAEMAQSRPPIFRELRSRAPFTVSNEQTLGVAYMKKGDYDRAVEYLAQAADLRPDRPSIQTDLERAIALQAKHASQ